MDIGDLPELLLRREGAFQNAPFLPEWAFWHYVAEREGWEKTLPSAVACARFYIENFVGLDKNPIIYREMVGKYQMEWWRSIPRPVETDPAAWRLFKLMDELENAAAELSHEFIYRRKGKSRLALSMRGARGDSARVEFEMGQLTKLFHIRVYHPLTKRHYWPEWFFGQRGAGHVSIAALVEMEERIAKVFDFCTRFLPVLANCTTARPPTPYDQVEVR